MHVAMTFADSQGTLCKSWHEIIQPVVDFSRLSVERSRVQLQVEKGV